MKRRTLIEAALPTTVALALSMVLAGCPCDPAETTSSRRTFTRESSSERKARERLERNGRQDVLELKTRMRAAAKLIPDEKTLKKDKKCSESRIRRSKGSKQLFTIDAELLELLVTSGYKLQRAGHRIDEPIDKIDEWAFVSDRAPIYIRLLEQRRDLAPHDREVFQQRLYRRAARVAKMRYWAVLAPNTKDLPRIDADDDYVPAELGGSLVVMDMEKNKAICHVHVQVNNSKSVKLTLDGASNTRVALYDALMEDLETNFKRAARGRIEQISSRLKIYPP